jgi:hypothetical protein
MGYTVLEPSMVTVPVRAAADAGALEGAAADALAGAAVAVDGDGVAALLHAEAIRPAASVIALRRFLEAINGSSSCRRRAPTLNGLVDSLNLWRPGEPAVTAGLRLH